jgi:hypothetical protein
VSQQPSLGRIVHYTLSRDEARQINKRRDDFRAFNQAHPQPIEAGQEGSTGHVGHYGNPASEGDVYPAKIVRLFDPSTTTANLQVSLDGTDTYWATSRCEAEDPAGAPGFWHWPPRV